MMTCAPLSSVHCQTQIRILCINITTFQITPILYLNAISNFDKAAFNILKEFILPCLLVLSFFLFGIRSHYVVLAVLELTETSPATTLAFPLSFSLSLSLF